ncbi:MAG: hypothetical protein IJF69_02005 [Clostridia bacterium]|nr:hypothetical protein [Clostridia bacterium]
MNKREVCFRIAAFFVAGGLICVSYGRELLISAFAENNQEKSQILVNDIKDGNSAIAELERKVVNKRKISVLQGNKGDIAFLCKSIKYNCRDLGEYLCYTNSNQELYCDSSTGFCVYYRYQCDIGEKKYSETQCKVFATEAVRAAVLPIMSIRISEVVCADSCEKYCDFLVVTDDFGGAAIKVRIRRDTGNVILYDATEVEKWIKEQKTKS